MTTQARTKRSKVIPPADRPGPVDGIPPGPPAAAAAAASELTGRIKVSSQSESSVQLSSHFFDP